MTDQQFKAEVLRRLTTIETTMKINIKMLWAAISAIAATLSFMIFQK